MKLFYRKQIFLFFVLFCFSLSLGQLQAKAEETKTIRVGYFLFENFQEIGADGSYNGYAYDYLQEVKQFTRWEYDYVVADFAECYQMLLDGKIDLMCGLEPYGKRQDLLDFSQKPLIENQYVLYALEDNEEISYGENASLDGKRVAVLEGNDQAVQLDRFCNETGITLEKVRYKNQTALLDALNKKQVDLLFCSSIADESTVKVVARFGSRNMYCAALKESGLMDEFDEAVSEISNTRPDFTMELYHKYLSGNTSYKPDFTKEEKEYIETAPIIQVVYDPDWYPIEYYDEKNGEFRGITRDLFELIAEDTGLEFSYQKEDNFANSAAVLKEGKVDILTAMTHDYNWADAHNAYLSGIYLETSVVLVTPGNREELPGVLALPKGYYTSDKIVHDLGCEAKHYDTIEECFDAVVSKKADGTYVNNYVANYYLSKGKYRSLQATQQSTYTENLAVAVSKDADPMLLSIFDKALLNISKQEKDAIVLKNRIAEETFHLEDFVYAYPFLVLFIALTVFGLCIICVWMVFKQKATHMEMEKAREAEASKTAFLATMSHEIRTPLNAVMGYISMSQENDIKKEKRQEYLEKAMVASRHLLSIINDVLDMSAIASGKLKIETAPFDLKKVIEEIQVVFAQQAISKEITFVIEQDAIEQKRLVGDMLRTKQILVNLVSNAMKFTPPGGRITLIVQQKAQEDDRVEMTFQVKDTGIGISKEFVKRMFAPFEQQDASVSRKYGGTGLGLSITKQLTVIMGGEIYAESEEGKGTDFIVKMPYLVAEIDEEVEKAIFSYEKIRVLVVDDDKDSCVYMQSLFARLKMKCDVAESGEAALHQLEKRQSGNYAYGLCIVDWKMEGMDGVETIRQIRSLYGKELPILMLTAYSMMDVAKEASDAGADKVAVKPLFQSVLFDFLLEHYGGNSKKDMGGAMVDFHGYTVLLAEDNEMNLEIANEMLVRTGLKVICAKNGRQACDLFRQAEPCSIHAILMDIQMPEMDGYEATRQIRSCGRKDAVDIPIIALTANAFTEDIRRAKEAGMNGHIAKPISKLALYRELKVLYNTPRIKEVEQTNE